MILLSVVNTKLRDYYENLDSLCADLGVNKETLINALAAVDYVYDKAQNQFI